MDYFFSDIVESSQNRTFLQKIKSFSEQAQQQVYVLKGPLTDAKYTYDIDDVCIILTRGKKITFVAFSDIDNDQFLAYRYVYLNDLLFQYFYQV